MAPEATSAASKSRPFFTLTVNWLVAALVLVAAYIVCYNVPLSDIATDPSLARLHVVARSIGVFLMVLSGFSAIVLVVVSIASLRDPSVTARYFIWVGVASVAPFLGYVVVALATWPMHELALERAARHGATIARAIETYTAEHGTPPTTLTELNLPTLGTGLAAYPEFSYERFDAKAQHRTLYWFDLGRRHGRSMTSDWIYPDGDTGHAILALEVDGDGAVASATADRGAMDTKPAPFERDGWGETPHHREAMVQDLMHQHPLVGMRIVDVEALLGPADGTRVLVDTPWELWTHTWPRERERFFYWPTHAYPKVANGQSVMAVGDWAYARD